MEIAAIEDEFVKPRRMYREEVAVTEAIDAIEGDGKVWEFERCWECVAARVPLLYDFFVGCWRLGNSLSRHSYGGGRLL